MLVEVEKGSLRIEPVRRFLFPHVLLAWSHQDPGDHPFNTYSEGEKEQDRKAHQDVSWLRDQVEKRKEDKGKSKENKREK